MPDSVNESPTGRKPQPDSILTRRRAPGVENPSEPCREKSETETNQASLTAFLSFALLTAASTISCPMRLMGNDTGPSSGLPFSRE